MRTAKVTKLHRCDIQPCDELASYDAKTKNGCWAYMCEKHFEEFGIGLGTGKGQRLELVDYIKNNI